MQVKNLNFGHIVLSNNLLIQVVFGTVTLHALTSTQPASTHDLQTSPTSSVRLTQRNVFIIGQCDRLLSFDLNHTLIDLICRGTTHRMKRYTRNNQLSPMHTESAMRGHFSS